MSKILKIGNKVLKIGGRVLVHGGTPVDPYNPLGLPPFTIRIKYWSGHTPTMGDSQTLVDASENVWDITKNSTDWTGLFRVLAGSSSMLLEILGANSTGVTNMTTLFSGARTLVTVSLFDTRSVTKTRNMFNNCIALTSVPPFDTSSCTDMSSMFYGCRLTSVPLFNTSSCTDMSSMFSSCNYLTSVPLFNTSSCTNMKSMFNGCVNVQSGALALYQQASTQATVPSHNTSTFKNCGRDTVTGAAELAQIPTSWGGTRA